MANLRQPIRQVWLGVLSGVLLACAHAVEANIVTSNSTSVVINLPSGNIQVYPSQDSSVDSCPRAAWKEWKLHASPPEYDPLHWSQSEWRDYIVEYPLRSAALSLAFLLVGLFTLAAALLWRCIQWCVSCGRCRHACSVGAEDTDFLGDTKHRYLKAWIYLLIAGVLAMVIWGMLGLDKGLLTTFWESVLDVLDYGDKVSGSLQTLQERVTADIPGNLSRGIASMNRTLGPDVLLANLTAGLDFAPVGLATANSLLSSTSSMRSSLQSSVLPGLGALADQLAGAAAAGARRRRRLAAAVSPASSYDTLGVLLPALSSGLPAIVGANATREGIQADLQALDTELSRVQAETITSASSPAVVALQAALQITDLSGWDTSLGDLATALEAYSAARSGPALQAVTDDANLIVAGSGPLSPSAVTQLAGQMSQLGSELQSGPLAALQSVQSRLQSIQRDVADISGWKVTLANGTKMQILELADLINQAATTILPYTLAANSSSALMQVAMKLSNGTSVLNSTAAQLASITTAAYSALESGPDPSPALTQVNATLRPALTPLASPVAAVTAALAQYIQAPSSANLDTLRAAATNASGPVAAAASDFSTPVTNAAGLASTAGGLQSGVATLGSVVSGLNGTLRSNYDALSVLSTDVLSEWEATLQGLVSLLNQLTPKVDQIEGQVRNALDTIQNKVSEVSQQVQSAVDDAGSTLEDAIAKLDDKLLGPAHNFVGDNRKLTEDIVNIVYPVWMAVWGLGALLVLLLAVSVWFNWPAGLVTVGLLLLALITLSQVITSVGAFGMAVLQDACDNVEDVAMRQLVQHTSSPQLAVVLSYYLYKVPADRDVMLQAAFNVNTTDVRYQLQRVNDTVMKQINGTVKFQGATSAVLRGLAGLSDLVNGMFSDLLLLVRYDTVHPLYVSAKASVCCDAGNFAYHQWCAMTAAACLSFAALLFSFYLLARMDMTGERGSGCCTCCRCAPYKPHNRYKADMEKAEEEDQFAKQARKQQELLLQQRWAREQALAQQHYQQSYQYPYQYHQQPNLLQNPDTKPATVGVGPPLCSVHPLPSVSGQPPGGQSRPAGSAAPSGSFTGSPAGGDIVEATAHVETDAPSAPPLPLRMKA